MSAQTRTDAPSLCSAGLGVTAAPSVTAAARCRYKTGRCMNPRVVKANGTLLLLCEYHRCQQNRTKKRSDMKYRQHRAAKRQLERAAQYPRPRPLPKGILDAAVKPEPRSIPALPVQHDNEHQPCTRNRILAPAAIQTGWLDNFTPVKPEDVEASIASQRNGRQPSAMTGFKRSTNPFDMTTSSPTTVADFESAVSPWPAHGWHDLHASSMSPPLLSFPQEWLPDELELLEYFIMS